MIYPQGGFGPFLSTPSARRATAGRHGSSATVAISIHALREEGDPPSSKSGRPSANFYPRPPRGGRLFCAARAASSRVFLSTPSARRATRAGEPFLLLPEISIHALREEGDTANRARGKSTTPFLSTPSARRATQLNNNLNPPTQISIHALREEGDAFRAVRGQRRGHFYPRPPRGGRLRARSLAARDRAISIHALREEGDPPAAAPVSSMSDFYPRPPRGGRLAVLRAELERDVISIHALREEGDLQYPKLDDPELIFLSTPSARRATKSSCTER